MKIKCDSQKLSEAVSNVQRAVSDKSSLAALEGILIKASNNNIYLCGYDLEIGITTNIEANVEEDGEIILNSRLFSDIIRKIPNEYVEISCDDRKITTITSGNSKFSIVGMSSEEYPKLPNLKDHTEINLSGDILKNMVRQTIFAVADNDANPVHKGILFEINDEEIILVGVDGYRLALRKEKIDLKEKIGETKSFVVPAKTLNEILKLIGDETKINMSIDKNHIIFNIEGYEIISRLLEGNFLNYRLAIPQETNATAFVNTRDFINSIERVSLIITDRLKSPLKCIFEKNQIKLSCKTAMGKANDEIEAPYEASEIEIGFNNKYLLDALKNSHTDEVRIELISPIKPIKIMPKKGDNFIFLVLPVRI